MHTVSYSKPVKALPYSATAQKSARKPVSGWKPQNPSLTREELREIVLDLIG